MHRFDKRLPHLQSVGGRAEFGLSVLYAITRFVTKAVFEARREWISISVEATA